MGTIGKSPEKGLEKLELQEGELMLLRRFLTVVEFDLSIKQGKSLLGRLNSLLLDKGKVIDFDYSRNILANREEVSQLIERLSTMKGDHIKNVLTTGEKFENKEEFKEKNYLLVLNHLAKKFGIKNKEEAIDDFKIWFFGDRKKYHFYDTIILLMEDIKAKLEGANDVEKEVLEVFNMIYDEYNEIAGTYRFSSYETFDDYKEAVLKKRKDENVNKQVGAILQGRGKK